MAACFACEHVAVAFEGEKAAFPNQNSTRSDPWMTRGPPPTTPAVVPTAVATPLPTVPGILPKLLLLWFATGLAKFVWLNRLKKSARKRRRTLSVPTRKTLAREKFKFD